MGAVQGRKAPLGHTSADRELYSRGVRVGGVRWTPARASAPAQALADDLASGRYSISWESRNARPSAVSRQ
jgi:hypothetical protein